LVESNKAETAPQRFNKRVVECRLAAKILGKTLSTSTSSSAPSSASASLPDTLRQVQESLSCTLDQMIVHVNTVLHKQPYTIEEITQILGPSQSVQVPPNLSNEFHLWKRAFHVYNESLLVQKFHQGGKAEVLGDLMNKSHQSCKELFECSCEELDNLVEICRSAGALGCRLTGAGWGGCTVSLVPHEIVGSFLQIVRKKYFGKVTEEAVGECLFQTSPGNGAFIVKL